MRIADLDIVFLSYDEPQADGLFAALQKLSPRKPLRVHGVKGFHAAHRRAAQLAKTDRFITVDGDNRLRPCLFDSSPDLNNKDVVYSYTAFNTVNGLAYGNGGVKIWPRQLVLTVPTHEDASGNDFCWTYRYWQVNETASDLYFAPTPYHAFRAAYRETVKLSLVKGEKLDWKSTRERIYPPNLARLLIWSSVGADVANGEWAMYGARCGLAHVWLDKIDPDLIRDYDWFAKTWTAHSKMDPVKAAIKLGERLNSVLNLDLPMFSAEQSRWFKTVVAAGVNVPRHGLMIPD